MRALVISDEVRQKIAMLRARADCSVTPLSAVQALSTKFGAGVIPGLNDDATIYIPDGFAVTYTHEQQRQCVCRHLSVSVKAARKGPHPAAMELLMEEFGFTHKLDELPSWLEPLGHDEFAVNVVEPLDGNVEQLKR